MHVEKKEPLEAAPKPVSAAVLSGDLPSSSGSDVPVPVLVPTRLAGEEPDGG